MIHRLLSAGRTSTRIHTRTRARARTGTGVLVAAAVTGSLVAGSVVLGPAAVGPASAAGRAPEAASDTVSGKPREGAVSGKPREAAALTGTGTLSRVSEEDISFTFDAHLAAEHTTDPTLATGTFRFSHRLGDESHWAEGRIDCLVTGGKVAVATGVITRTDLPDAKGNRVGFTVHDQGRRDRLGYSWASVGNPEETKDLPKCVSSAPFEKIRGGTGNFRVLPWNPDFVE
ncbi:hypothetical protein [Streptomyces griseiscabiei]|uniref:Repetin n=1 Tax=Streptomyces griseiscabiei TaxID=2993540 RepID=A0ABU4L2E4_9ACTN|nr:hypothetical protein [Streptomyces griseiscabiei]MDX2909920.1 hypothetical protein [Streptomyces griseiscabiei]